MGIDSSPADRKRNQFSELPKQTTTNNKSKKNRRRHKKPSPVQQLYEICNHVFASTGTGTVPPSPDIERIRSVLDKMKPVDVGLSPEMPYFRTTAGQRSPPPITYLHIYENSKFSMGIFCLPPSGVIPLHNHPGMTVFSKLLFGTMHIKAYDWAEVGAETSASATVDASNGTSSPSSVRLAKVKVDANCTAPCDASILYPADGGNIHCFTAVTACAVLDVLGPPYNDRDGRHCSYYLSFPFTKFSVDGVSVTEEEREGYAWLEEREQPEDLAAVGAVYRGPKIVEN
ncbi:plant cysteine oxidase 2-like [Momordica charantia]|uniref:cysteine dioxygenase n=1 Tax=Momordica charantia TaxID=3673 RepID=A0A6J1DZ27_MOMCH|nr:plant cysteine oxidase 2-like [Momordica charantia]